MPTHGDDTPAPTGDDQPLGWIQFHDGTWAFLWPDGHIGPPLPILELTQTTRTATVCDSD